MSGELESVGAAATAGLAAGAIEGREARKAGDDAQCANCGAPVMGRYCANCGQATHVTRSLWRFLEEALHGLTQFDSKIWRTLPKLALRPGTLTRDYIDGCRARYVSPLALFLFCIFLMFAGFAFTGGSLDAASARSEGEAARQGLKEASAELAAEEKEARAKGDAAGARARAATRAVIDAAAKSDAVARAPGTDVVVAAPESGDLMHELRDAEARGDIDINLGAPWLNEAARRAIRNPELTAYKLQEAASKFAFLLVPLSLPFISLLFLWKRGLTLFDHTVFALYSLSFMSLLFLSISVLTNLLRDIGPLSGFLGALSVFAPPVHMFFQLGGAYRLGWFSALWRTAFLLAFCMLIIALFSVLVVLIGVLG